MEENGFSIRKYVAVTAILLVLVMTVLDVTVVNVALPVMAVEFGVSDSYTVWIVTVYQLVITMLLLPLSCAASRSFGMIVASRAVQGMGAACVMGVNIALTRLIYPREVLGRGLALNSMVIAIATAAGPTIAGAVLSVASWHWLFLINIPFGIGAFVIGRKYLPVNPKRDMRPRYDWVSAIENALVFGLIFYSLGSFARKGDAVTNARLLTAGVVTVCGVGFGMFQTPNNIVMVIATPVNRTGGAGGMQSTARLVGQTLGATTVTVVFALMASPLRAVDTCLAIALCMAVTAGIFSLSRVSRCRRDNG